MKLNLEVELDWIDEEMNLDESVKQNVINAVVGKIQANVEAKVEKTINGKIDQIVVSRINKMTDKVFNDFMNREIMLADNYGDKIKAYKNVRELIKERFDKFMTQLVNENGEATENDRYGTKYKRLEFIIDKQLKDFANSFTTQAVKQVSEEIKLHVQAGLTTKLGAELMKVLKVNEMLQLPSGK